MRPSTPDASNASDKDAGGFHDEFGAWLLHQLWCAASLNVAQVPTPCVPCPRIVRLEGEDSVVIFHCGLEL